MSVKVRWGVNTGVQYKEGGWCPLWKRDSQKLEMLYANGDINAEVCIRNTHAMASIATREVIENYNDDAPVRTLVRGTWFWRFGGSKPSSKLVAFHEDTATDVEEWYQHIKEEIIKECLLEDGVEASTSTGTGPGSSATGVGVPGSNGGSSNANKPWVLPVGEIMGPGGGQFRLVATRNNIHSTRIKAKYQYAAFGGPLTSLGRHVNESPSTAGAMQSLPSDADFVSHRYVSSTGASTNGSNSSNNLSINLGAISAEGSPTPSNYSSAVNSPLVDFHDAAGPDPDPDPAAALEIEPDPIVPTAAEVASPVAPIETILSSLTAGLQGLWVPAKLQTSSTDAMEVSSKPSVNVCANANATPRGSITSVDSMEDDGDSELFVNIMLVRASDIISAISVASFPVVRGYHVEDLEGAAAGGKPIPIVKNQDMTFDMEDFVEGGGVVGGDGIGEDDEGEHHSRGGADIPTGHLVFMIHGVGEALWKPHYNSEAKVPPSASPGSGPGSGLAQNIKATAGANIANNKEKDTAGIRHQSEFAKNDMMLDSFRRTVNKFSALCQECVVEDYAEGKRMPTVLPTWKDEGTTGTATAKAKEEEGARAKDEGVAPVPRPSRYRVDCIPIEWHDTLHDQNSELNKRIRCVTNHNVPLMREFGNAAGVDLLAYQTIEYRTRILNAVSTRMNNIYQTYCRLNPHFTGRCSIIGHSLGSVIAFDILSVQPKGIGEECALSCCAQQQHHNHGDGDGEASVAELHRHQLTAQPIPVLAFRPQRLFIVGSPVALFCSLRSDGAGLSRSYRLPTCPEVYNVFHPYDPVAYRIEPLYDYTLQQSLSPVVLAHHSGNYIHYQVHMLGKEIDDGINRIKDNLTWFSSTVTSTVNQVVVNARRASSKGEGSEVPPSVEAPTPDTPSPFPIDIIPIQPGEIITDSDDLVRGEGYDEHPAAAELLGLPPQQPSEKAAKTKSAAQFPPAMPVRVPLPECMLNGQQRIDHTVQETMLENSSTYIAAMSAHSSYFENKDVAM